MSPRVARLMKGLSVLAGLAAGVALFGLLVSQRQAPTHDAAAAAAPVVAVIEVRALPLRLAARGHGTARPAETWQAVANVSGRVVERHPRLEDGALLPAGTPLLTLDPSRYELAIAEAEAELASLAAELAQLATEETNTRDLRALERERLALAERELERVERLAANNAVSRSQRDAQRRATLAQRQAVAALDNQLALMPARRQRLEAQHERAATRLAQARRDLEDTRFVAPYDLRLAAVEVERHQFAAVGQRLFTADSIEAAEVEAHFPIAMLRRLLGGVPSADGDGLDITERLDLGAIDAEVVLVGAEDVRWPARVTRIASGMAPGTRSVRVVLRVEEPYRHAAPPERPALQRDMYLRAELHAMAPAARLVVPASAVHQGEVYVVGEDDTLVRRAVTVAFEQHDLAVIAAGLAAGERVIVDDLAPAVAGMAVTARRDTALEARLRAGARGDGTEEVP
ncbi:efflux RND transporter periplasmic adaptor subunit [Billgrantia azerbaijanica]|nr:efflux RND transporter periplasmic adaptor subunit [Halomonas azerbaijanica]